jgi:hypothetical protein
MLLETLAGHLALLQSAHPRKAKSPVAKRVMQCVRIGLKDTTQPRRLAA